MPLIGVQLCSNPPPPPDTLPGEERNVYRQPRLALLEKGNGSLLIDMMEDDPIQPVWDYNQDDIRLNALRLKVAAKVQGKK